MKYFFHVFIPTLITKMTCLLFSYAYFEISKLSWGTHCSDEKGVWRGGSTFPSRKLGSIFYAQPGSTLLLQSISRGPSPGQGLGKLYSPSLSAQSHYRKGRSFSSKLWWSWVPREPLWNPSAARKVQGRTSLFQFGFFWETHGKGIPRRGLKIYSCPWHIVACPSMPPLAPLLWSWHSFLPGERAPQHHLMLILRHESVWWSWRSASHHLFLIWEKKKQKHKEF